VIEFRVEGQPVPQGSMKVINGHIIHSQGSALAAWRSAIALAAKKAGAKPSEYPISMVMAFIMPRPRTVKRPEPSVPPDLDKLIRAALDALTAIAYKDDGQVTEVRALKVYGEYPGVEIRIVEKK
jgi:Holliday junction resolvase RusA-like endonuclease